METALVKNDHVTWLSVTHVAWHILFSLAAKLRRYAFGSVAWTTSPLMGGVKNIVQRGSMAARDYAQS